MLPLCQLLIATLLLAPIASQDVPPGTDPVLTVQGQSFFSWDEYKQSALFGDAGLHCGTVRDEDAAYAAAAPSDCTYGFTNPSQEYAPTTLIEIPIVVHCMYQTNGVGYITEAVIESEILQLNQRFRAFTGGVGGAGNDSLIQFHLATEDENGQPTNGITYRSNNTWFNDGGQYWNTLAWDPTRYMNIYTNNAAGNLGYVSVLPQQGGANTDRDRVVLLWSTVGVNAPIGFPYDQGTIGAHEVGHYLGLHHTFSGGCAPTAGCATNGDAICDTPPSSSSAACPPGIQSCGVPDPFENYMSYGDPCMTEFTAEQILRMRCSIEHYRSTLPVQSVPGTWTDLGGGTTGSNGSPTLVGDGVLLAGSIATLELDSAPPGAAMLAWLSVASAPTSFFGGTIHALPFINQFFVSADGTGGFATYTTWPEGVPPGSEAWFQFLVADPSVIWGITLSNAVKASTP